MNAINAPQMSASLNFKFIGTNLTAEYMVSDVGITILFSSDAIRPVKNITLSAMAVLDKTVEKIRQGSSG